MHMTFDELREATEPIADQLAILAFNARSDDFAPWIVEALETAATYARLQETTLAKFREWHATSV